MKSIRRSSCVIKTLYTAHRRICNYPSTPFVQKSSTPYALVRTRTTQKRYASIDRSIRSLSTSNREEKEFLAYERKSWEDLVKEFERSDAIAFSKNLHPKYPLWLPPSLSKKVNYFQFYSRTKREHPEKIIFVFQRNGYEAVGIDAVMMMNYAQMQPSGADGVPRVRCSDINFAFYLKRIVRDCGFEVVICESSDEMLRIGSRRIPKQHYIAEVIVSAGDSYYLNTSEDSETYFERSYPMAAVFWSQTGFSLVCYFTKENTLSLTSRMSEESLWAKLKSTGMTTPLYLHQSSLPGTRVDTSFQIWEKKAKDIAMSVFGSVEAFRSDDPVKGFLQLVKQKHPHLDIEKVKVFKEDIQNRVLPPPLSTVSEIGIYKRWQSGVPMLLEEVLPLRSTELVKSWVRKCLVDPPSPELASSIQRLERDLSQTIGSIPKLNARLFPTKIVEVLSAKRSNTDFVNFLELLNRLLYGIADFVDDPATSKMTPALLKVVERETNVLLEETKFRKDCRSVIRNISKMLREDFDAIWEEQDRERTIGSYKIKASEFNKDKDLDGFYESTLPSLFHKVQPKSFEKENERLQQSWQNVKETIDFALSVELPSLNPKQILLDAELMSILFIVEIKPSDDSIITPDRSKPKQITTKRLAHSLSEYSNALQDWEVSLRKQLDKLHTALNKQMTTLVAASHASIILAALTDHVTEAEQRGWSLPDISSLVSKERSPLIVENFWPYWMPKEESTVNSIELDRMTILTGPNMAGKSTILRSIAAVCCLGVSGFYVPATFAKLPFMDCINLKTMVHDSPYENRSSFAVEMSEMKHVLHDATQNTLLLIDELGKGTEVSGGTALSTAIFEDLYRRGAFGIFATHLHRIKEFQTHFPEALLFEMEIDQKSHETKRPTWKMKSGFCEESLGLEVALGQGIPSSIVDRAKELIASIEH